MTQASTALTRPLRGPRPEPVVRSPSGSKPRTKGSDERRLWVIPARASQRKLPFLLLVGLIVVAGVLGLSALNVAVNQQAFKISELTQANGAVDERYSVLQAEVDTLSSPARIAGVARDRGLAPVTSARIEPWPQGQRTETPAATSPAASDAPEDPPTSSGERGNGAVWTADDPFPLKHYLAQR